MSIVLLYLPQSASFVPGIKIFIMPFSSFSVPAAHRIWALIYLAGESSCRSVQYIIRPLLPTHEGWLNYLLCVAPNFLAGVYVPACFTFLMPYLLERKPERRNFQPQRYRWPACVFTLSGLLGWEFFQPYTRRFVFDVHDIIWTFIGVSVYLFISQRKTVSAPLPRRVEARQLSEVNC